MLLLKYKAAGIRAMIRHELSCPIASAYWRGAIKRAIIALAEEGI